MKNKIILSVFIKIIAFTFLIEFVISCTQKSDLTKDEKEYLKENTELKVAVYPYYAPYQFINEQGEIDGIFIDLMKLIEYKNKIKFKKIYYNNWEDVLTDAKNNKIDLILEIQKNESRSQYLNFFEPFFESQVVLVQNKNTKKIDGLENFGNLKMVLPKKYSTVETIESKYPKINVSYEINDVECLKKVNNGKFDAFIGPRALVNYFIKKEKLKNLILTDTIAEKYTPSFATSKQNAKLTSIIEKSLNNISSSEKKAIIDNWLFNQIVPFYEKSNFWIFISSGILGLLFIITVISLYLKDNIKKRTQELFSAKVEAEESNNFKTILIQNISHEIRTPMNGIIGFSELLKSNDLSKDDRDKYLDIISKSTKDLENSINNILDISQLETKQMTVQSEFLNLTNLLQELYAKFLPMATLKKLKFDIETNPENENLILKTDRKKLSKILSYIIDNAIKFTKIGFVKISYSVSDKNLVITIEDSGIGIDISENEFIFNSFSQSEKAISKNYGGLGLGLYFAKKYSVLLNGQISFRSINNSGSSFYLYLLDIVTTNDTNNDVGKLSKNNTNDNKYNVLVAEDGDINFLLIQKMLSKNTKYQFNITRAEDGQKTLDLYTKNHYDLVLMDIKMPKIDGYEATKALKKINPELLIIAQTAFSRDEDIKKAYDAGCDDFLAKPLDSLKLNLVLDKYLTP